MSDPEPTYDVVHLPVSELIPDPFQPRKTFKESAVRELAGSIEKHGILQPILVRPLVGAGHQGKYCIVAGERRFRAAQMLGLRTVPCHIRPYLTSAAAVIALAENVHRVDLSELEKAESLYRIKTLTDKTWEQVAELVGLSTDYVKRLAGLLRLEETVKEWVREGKISTRVAIALRPLPPRRQIEMAERAVREGLTAEQIRSEANAGKAPRSRRLAVVPELPEVAAGLEPASGSSGRGHSVVSLLRDLTRAVAQVDEWVEGRDWSPSKVPPRQRQALQELRQQVSLLQQHLISVCEPLREAGKTDAEKLKESPF